MRPSGSPELLEERRRRAVRLLRDGMQPVEVAQMLGVDRRSVRRWNQAAREGGAKALAGKPASGRPVKLSAKQRGALERILLKGAVRAGFPTDLWTCPRIARVIEEHFGVSYHVDHLGRLLHAMGFSPQKPQRRAVERDEEAISGWVREQWPRIKKKPAG